LIDELIIIIVEYYSKLFLAVFMFSMIIRCVKNKNGSSSAFSCKTFSLALSIANFNDKTVLTKETARCIITILEKRKHKQMFNIDLSQDKTLFEQIMV